MTRAVMFVWNDFTHDARVLREARALVEAGHQVTVVARWRHADPALARRERIDGFEVIRVPVPRRAVRRWMELRYYPWRAARPVAARLAERLRARRGKWPGAVALLVAASLLAPWAAARAVSHVISGDRSARLRRRPPSGPLAWLLSWRDLAEGWAARAARAVPAADVYHAHDLTALPAAVRAARRDGSILVYDAHELFLESTRSARQPAWARAILARFERLWGNQARAVLTVNDGLADELRRRYAWRRIVPLYNCSPRWAPRPDAPDLLRAAAGVPRSCPVVLYHGGFQPGRGMEQLARALLHPELADVHAVYLGGGPALATLQSLAEDASWEGRLHVLPAVPPDDLPAWISSADVCAALIQPSTLNHRLSTPNKLFEALAAGVPVLASDFPAMRRIVLEDPRGPLGKVCDPADVEAITAALSRLLRAPAEERAALRARCLAAAHGRWNWQTESRKLIALYDELSRAAHSKAASP